MYNHYNFNQNPQNIGNNSKASFNKAQHINKPMENIEDDGNG